MRALLFLLACAWIASTQTALCVDPTAEHEAGVQTSGPAAPPVVEADSVAYRVYSALLNQHYGNGTQFPLVILGQAVEGPEETAVDHHFRLMLESALEPGSPEVIEKYQGLGSEVAAEPPVFRPVFELPRPYAIVSQASRDSLFSICPGGWDRFAERYPTSRGYITLSTVIFDSRGVEALVYTEDHCGMWCAEGTFVLLRKEVGEWKVARKLTLWVS